MRRIGHAYISHHPRRRAVAQAARFSTSINRPAQPTQRPKPNNTPQSANLDAATPPREGRRSRPIPGTGTTPPRGILGLGPVSLTLVMLVLSGLGWFGYVPRVFFFPFPHDIYVQVSILSTVYYLPSSHSRCSQSRFGCHAQAGIRPGRNRISTVSHHRFVLRVADKGSFQRIRIGIRYSSLRTLSRPTYKAHGNSRQTRRSTRTIRQEILRITRIHSNAGRPVPSVRCLQG